MLLINFFGSPGSGKSTLALRAAGELKSLGYNAEFAPEYIKTLIASGDNSYSNLELLTHQFKQIKAFYDKSDVVVTDSPILLSSVYTEVYGEDVKIYGTKFLKSFRELTLALHENYFKNKIDILVLPCFEKKFYKESLRLQTFEESIEIYEKYFKNLVDYDLRVSAISDKEHTDKTLGFIVDTIKDRL